MKRESLWNSIESAIDRGEYQAYEDWFHIALESGDRDRLRWLSHRIEADISRGILVVDLYELHKRVLLEMAQWDFESYLLYMEWNREPDKKFYPPRRKGLARCVQALQRLADDELDLLSISLPPGVGKTTLAIFFICWLAGREPNLPILCGSHSNSLVSGMYDECLRMIASDEYTWGEIFPAVRLANTKARELSIDLDKPKRFSTLEFTSVGSSNAGRLRCQQLLYCDDLIDGIETAMNYDRLDKLWSQYHTDLRQRKQGDCKELHIATRWSVHDVLGRLERQYGESDRAEFISFPALDENDESNFNYPFGVGFSTEFYHAQREIMDDVSWKCLYMNQPIEREGLLYEQSELRYYYELPEDEPDAIISVCDTKATGDDYCVMPVAYVYGDDYYIEDVICDNGKIEMIDARMVELLIKNNVQQCRIESNNAGGRTADTLQKNVKERGGNTHITKAWTQSNKETKIVVNSPWVKEHCFFKENGSKEYKKFLSMLCAYSISGKNKHDDVPDAMAMLSIFAQSFGGNKVTILKRLF